MRSEPLLFLLLFSFLPIVESGFAHRARRARAQIHRYVKRIYKSRNVCRAMYTWRTALSLKKISRDAYARLCVYDCTRRGFTSSYICGQCFSLQHAAILRFSSLSSHFPIAFLSPCSLTHSFPQYRSLSKPVHKRFITMTLR